MSVDDMTLKRARKGDIQAFEAVIDAYEGMVYRVCLRMLVSPEDAMDASQETAVRIWKSLDKFHGNSALSTWVYRIATNTCLDLLRKRKDQLSIDALGEEGYDPPAPQEDTPEFQLESRQSRDIIAAELGRLPIEQRAAVVLRDVQGLSYEEVASALDVNLNTAKSRISRGRRSLQRALAAHAELFGMAYVQKMEGST